MHGLFVGLVCIGHEEEGAICIGDQVNNNRVADKGFGTMEALDDRDGGCER